MKASVILALALLGSGCATSKFANDPRAFLVGPDYLDYIAQYPRDRDTQYYYPVLTLRGLTNWVDPNSTLPTPSFEARIDALLVPIPNPTEKVKENTGKGWARLERKGVSMSATPNY